MVFTLQVVDPIQKVNPLKLPPEALGTADKIMKGSVHNSMVGIMHQIFMLAEQATNIFNTLIEDAGQTANRITKLNEKAAIISFRSTQVRQRYQPLLTMQLGNPERIGPHKMQVNTYFHDTHTILLMREKHSFFLNDTMPSSVRKLYTATHPPPKLHTLDKYMENNQKALALYTNPSFFLNEWIAEQERQRDEAKRQRRERRKKRAEQASRKPKKNEQAPVEVRTLMITKYDPVTGQKILVPAPTSKGGSSPVQLGTMRNRQHVESPKIEVSMDAVPPSPSDNERIAPPPASPRYDAPPPPPSFSEPQAPNFSAPPPPPSFSAPAPPPPPDGTFFGSSAPEPPPQEMFSPPPQESFSAPAPPPPPSAPVPPPAPEAPAPPPAPGAPPPPAVSGGGSSGLLGELSKAKLSHVDQAQKAKPVDDRSDLMNQIKSGLKLKSAGDRVLADKQQEDSAPKSVAEILSRRIAIVGDSSSEDEDDDDDEWD